MVQLLDIESRVYLKETRNNAKPDNRVQLVWQGVQYAKGGSEGALVVFWTVSRVARYPTGMDGWIKDGWMRGSMDHEYQTSAVLLTWAISSPPVMLAFGGDGPGGKKTIRASSTRETETIRGSVLL